MFADFLTNDEISQLIGKRLRAKRLSGNILIDQLADRCGVNRKTIIEVEAGKDVKLSSLIKIMRGLQAIGNLEAAFPDLLPGTEGISSRGQPRLKASIGRKKHAK